MHNTTRPGRVHETLPCTSNKSVTSHISEISIDKEPIKRHLINDCSNKKADSTFPTSVFIFFLNSTRIGAKSSPNFL